MPGRGPPTRPQRRVRGRSLTASGWPQVRRAWWVVIPLERIGPESACRADLPRGHSQEAPGWLALA